MLKKSVYEETNDTYSVTIMVTKDNDCWGIYYRMDDSPFLYAFGISTDYTVKSVFDLAHANIPCYLDMFEC